MKKEYRKKLLKYRIVLLFIVIGLVLDVAMIGPASQRLIHTMI